MNTWVVLKFGGSSVSSLAKWKVIVATVKQRLAAGYKVVLVHSAAQGLTDLLAKKVAQNDDIYGPFKDKLVALCKELKVDIQLVLMS